MIPGVKIADLAVFAGFRTSTKCESWGNQLFAPTIISGSSLEAPVYINPLYAANFKTNTHLVASLSYLVLCTTSSRLCVDIAY